MYRLIFLLACCLPFILAGQCEVAIADNYDCSFLCNGTLVAEVVEGTPPFSYEWSDPAGENSPVISGLCPGSYFVTMTDATGCSTVQTASVFAMASDTTFLFTQTCDSNAISDTLVMQGQFCDSVLVFNVEVLPADFDTLTVEACEGEVFVYQGAAIPAGTSASFIYTNSLGCDSVVTVLVEALDVPAVEILGDSVLTCNMGSLLLLAVVEPPGNNSYSWQDENGEELGNGQIFEALNAMVLYLVVTNEAGCTQTDSIAISFAHFPYVNVEISNGGILSCANPEVTISNNIEDDLMFAHEWYDPDGNIIATENEVVVMLPGEYSMVVWDSLTGCANYEVIAITSIPDPVEEFNSVTLLPGESWMGQTFDADTTVVDTIHNTLLDCYHFIYTDIFVEDVAVNETEDVSPGLLVSPNPGNGSFRVHIVVKERQDATFFLHNAQGKTLETWNSILLPGNVDLPLELEAYPPGVYLLVLETPDGRKGSRIVKM